MARVKSIISLRGRIGDTVFLRRNGQTIAGLPGGASKDKILTAPEFANTRKNMAEFGQCLGFANDLINLGVKSQGRDFIFTVGGLAKAKRKATQILLQLRKYNYQGDIFGQRVINENTGYAGIYPPHLLQNMIIERKGNFDFSLIQFNEIELTEEAETIKARINPLTTDLTNFFPFRSDDGQIRLSLNLVQIPRRVFELGEYKRSRPFLVPYNNVSNTKFYTSVIEPDIQGIFAEIYKPNEGIGEPALSLDDAFFFIVQKSIFYKNNPIQAFETSILRTTNIFNT